MHDTGDATPRGGFLASAAASGSPDAAEVRAAIAAERRGIRDILIRRIETDITQNRLSPETPGLLADLALALTQGLSVLARDTGARDRLLAVADAATAGWGIYER